MKQPEFITFSDFRIRLVELFLKWMKESNNDIQAVSYYFKDNVKEKKEFIKKNNTEFILHMIHDISNRLEERIYIDKKDFDFIIQFHLFYASKLNGDHNNLYVFSIAGETKYNKVFIDDSALLHF